MNAFVQGGSGGIGLALVEQLLLEPDVERVFAASRSVRECDALTTLERQSAGRLELLAVDVCCETEIAAAARHVRARCEKLHLLLDAAGLLHGAAIQPEKRLEDVDSASLLRSFQVNAVAPLLLAKHFCSLLTHSERAVLANISARVGSIADNRLGGWYAYRSSKAAQNMATKTLSIELGRRAPNIICVALHPGTVDTALSRPFQRSVAPAKLFSPQRAAKQLLSIIDSLEPEESGSFFAWDRQPIPW